MPVKRFFISKKTAGTWMSADERFFFISRPPRPSQFGRHWQITAAADSDRLWLASIGFGFDGAVFKTCKAASEALELALADSQ